MNSERKKLILGIASVITLALIAVFCVSAAAVCFHIFKTEGDMPFSRESVGAHAVYFIPQLILATVAAIASGTLSLIFGKETGKLRAPRDEYKTLRRIALSAKKKSTDKTLPTAAIGERKVRLILKAIFAVITLGALIFSLIFALDTSRYSLEDINGDVLRTVLVILPLTVAVLAVGYVLDLIARRSAVRETEILKRFIAEDDSELAPCKECRAAIILGKAANILARPAVAYSIKGSVLVIAIVFIAVGIANGGMSDVLGKAVRICTECIGLG